MNDDLISRSALLEQECFMDDDNGFRCSVVLSTDVRRAPAVDPVTVFKQIGLVKEAFEMAKADLRPVRHGRWELKRHKLFGNSYDYVCSACGCDYALAEYNYCPHCGAKMDGGAADADSV